MLATMAKGAMGRGGALRKVAMGRGEAKEQREGIDSGGARGASSHALVSGVRGGWTNEGRSTVETDARFD